MKMVIIKTLFLMFRKLGGELEVHRLLEMETIPWNICVG